MSERLVPPRLPPRPSPKSSPQLIVSDNVAVPLVGNDSQLETALTSSSESKATSSTTSPGDDQATFEAEAWRRKLEDAEIERYLTHFAKHVDHLRVPVVAKPEVVERPRIQDYTTSTLMARRRQLEAVRREDQETLASNDEATAKDPETPDVLAFSDASEIEWIAFVSAYLRYLVGPSTPPPPVEPFTLSRLRSNTERLYTVARPCWESFGQTVGDVLLWRNKLVTGTVVFTYFMLVTTSLLLPALLLAPLYPILKHRFFPPSIAQQYQASLAASSRADEISDLTEDLIDNAEEDTSALEPGQGIGVSVNFSGPTEYLRASVGEARAGLGSETASQAENVKRGKGKNRLRRGLHKLETEYGSAAVVVVGDLADLHEKVKNLYLWRSPRAANAFIAMLLSASIGAHFCPLWILVKLFQIAIGAVLFIIVPLIAAQERYEPMSWMAGSAPTDAEYAMELLKKRGISGESLVVGPSPSSMTKKDKLKDVSGRSSKWLETARQIAAGESQIKLAFAAPSADVAGQTTKGTDSASMAQRGPRLVLSQRDSSGHDRVSTYLAQYGRSPGNLRVSPEGISFHPLIPARIKVTPNEVTQTASTIDNVAIPDGDGNKTSIVRNRDIHIAMTDVVGIRKRDKRSLFVIISTGLEIECTDGTSVVFPFVAERDRAFTAVLSLSRQSFSKI
ncbi:hypothetical protein BCR39DRAFT_533345 [Naematelia encephala]|uniref:Uncharacterized protein n=1 Tax=Naematelia encephala TaxID=71784 RepID=A0A1Y2B2D0_9TREE|nr:hypothetical protein BCR39DRAFT_533345 [Naematelia encephala]